MDRQAYIYGCIAVSSLRLRVVKATVVSFSDLLSQLVGSLGTRLRHRTACTCMRKRMQLSYERTGQLHSAENYGIQAGVRE